MANRADPQVAANGANGAVPPASDATTGSAPGLSADEIALYDRQIRLWGAHAQERIRSAHILLVSLRALGTEIAKNLTLAGINSLTIIDDELVTEENLGSQYFLREDDVGKPRAQAAIPRIQELNPRVKVQAGVSRAELLANPNQEFFEPYSCVIVCDADYITLSVINTVTHFANRPFYAAGIHGLYGYIFADLVLHDFVVEREKPNVATAIGPESLTRTILAVSDKKQPDGKTTELVRKQEIYCPMLLANSAPLPPDVLANRRKIKAVPALLPCLRALFQFEQHHSRLPSRTQQDLATFSHLAKESATGLNIPLETLTGFLRNFIQSLGAEIVPTAAFVGGRLSEDVINVLGRREQPIQNFALFDGDALEGRIYSLWSPPPEISMAAAGGIGNGAPLLLDDHVGAGMVGVDGMVPPAFDGAAAAAGVAGQGGAGMAMDSSMGADLSVAPTGISADTSAPAQGSGSQPGPA